MVDNDTGKSVDSQIRTSTGMFFVKGEDEIIKRIEKRVSQVSMIPVGEPAWLGAGDVAGRRMKGVTTCPAACG